MFGMFRQAQIQAQWLARCTCNASRNRRRPSSRDALARTLALAVVITGVQLRGSARALGRVDEAYRYNQLLGRGINLGNALEAPQEGAWGVTLKTHYFQDRSAMRSPRWSGSPRRGIRPASKGCRLQAHADRRPRILERRRSPRQPALAGKRPADDRYLPLLCAIRRRGLDPRRDAWKGTTWKGSAPEQEALARDFNKAAEWASRNKRPIHVGEFGVYREADMASRARWTKSVVGAAQARPQLVVLGFCSDLSPTTHLRRSGGGRVRTC